MIIRAVRGHPRRSATCTWLACLLVALLVTGCNATPKRDLANSLHDRLLSIRTSLVQFEQEVSVPCGGAGEDSRCTARARSDAVNERCNPVGEVRGNLYSEVAPNDIPGLYDPLYDATSAVLAACGQLWLLQFAYREGGVVDQAHQQWQAGFDQQLRTSCDLLHTTATRLGRAQPDCATSSS